MPFVAVPVCLGVVVLTTTSVFGQQVAWWGSSSGHGCPAPCPLPEMKQLPSPVPQEGQPPEQARPPSDLTQPPSDLGLDTQRFAGLGGEGVALPNMIGDLVPLIPRPVSVTTTVTVLPAPPAAPPPSNSAALRALAIVRASLYKVADDENPRPQDRIYFSYNGFFNVNDRVNAANGVDVGTMDVHAETLGVEKTFFDRNASIGLRLPLDTLTADNGFTSGSGGTFTEIGDLSIIGKFLLGESRQTGSLISAGLMITVPTGSDTFAGAPARLIANLHDTLLQPFVGYAWICGDFYLHGFESVQVPTDSNDVTLLFTDIGVGYFVWRNPQHDGYLTSIAPTAEVHLNNFLNHRIAGSLNDWVVLVEGVHMNLRRRSTLTLAVGEPVTGPKPYDVEAVVQFNLRF
jgi:hypothetical protein